jgi:hypothetical protein
MTTAASASRRQTPFPYAVSADTSRAPLVVRAPQADTGVATLCDSLRAHADWVGQSLAKHGALLLSGFDVSTAADFENVARAIDDDLKNEYLGTSPRDGLTDYVFSASELPDFYPIPQHCEMSFTARPPRRVFFCCLREPRPGGGETPLVDFREVYRDLDPDVRMRFEHGGIRIVRNYAGPDEQSRFNLFQLKPWDAMFLTRDRAIVEETCRREGFEPVWTAGDGLRLISTQRATRLHPFTGEPVWYNHSQVFHLSAAPGEYKRIFRHRPTLRNFALWQLARVLVAVQRMTRAADERSMHCTYEDGREIPAADMEHLRDVIWRHMQIRPWKRGDVLAIDNHSVAHGRLPYSGPREIAVCWA